MSNSISSILGGAGYTTSAKSGSLSSSGKVEKDPVSEFLAYQKLSPQEKIADAILKKYGLTKEDLANMTPKELESLQEKIKTAIQQELKNQMTEKGILVDMSA